ncbi:MAG: HlyC/CorC family transporter [Acidipila sp.]|nr:HlyC/CorC family transporter [Acidipila sp.]
MTSIKIAAVLLLVGINAFFAAVEFSLVAVRPSRIRQLVEQGVARARVVQRLLGDMNRVVSGVQVGVTLTSLGLGILGENTLASLLRRLLDWIPYPQVALVAHAISLGLAFAGLTFLHVVFGELVPKTFSLERAEQVALLTARPFNIYLDTFQWAIALLEGSAARINRALGISTSKGHTLVHSAEELQILVEQAGERGLFDRGEKKVIKSAIELSEVRVREIMVPRPDVHGLALEATLDEVMKTFATTQRSRLLVYQGSLDHTAGFVHIKDILWVLLDRERRAQDGLPPQEFQLRPLLREVLIVPESKPVSELLDELRARHTGLATVVDEFGTILGLVTLEDVLEQIVGEIYDEFDVVERPLTLADGAMIFDASLKVRDLETQFDIQLPDHSEYETLGGFVLHHLGFLPRGGETFDAAGFRFTVVEMDRRRVARVKIQRIKALEVATTAKEGAR